ncbi:MAG: DUF3575 domain-containing protein [Muribaculaceae bacterium]|nr:DUF3575 domain-containing protein [Muribaculaceae bacterium]
MKRVIAYTFVVFAALFAFGQSKTDSSKVYFSINRGIFDPAFDNNRSVADSLIEKISAAAAAHKLTHIDIHSYASPDGPIKLNERLAEMRGNTLKDYIIAKTGIDSTYISVTSGGIAWEELRNIVAAESRIPAQKQILNILDDPTLNATYHSDVVAKIRGGEDIEDKRKQKLQSLNNGEPYQWLLKNIFPRLRYAVAITVYQNPDTCEYPVPDNQTLNTDTSSSCVTDSIKQVVDAPQLIADDSSTTFSAVPKSEPFHRLALKTNLLYYLVLTPNIELEWLINKHWSAAIEFDGNSVGKYSGNHASRLGIISAEGRRWIKPRAPWHGMFVGLFTGGGWYDFLNNDKGYYGEGGIVGISFGYMWPIRKNLSFEGSIGAGYLYTQVKEYTPFEGHHLYQRTKSLNYFGPLKLKFSIVWRFLDWNKHKRINRTDEN